MSTFSYYASGTPAHNYYTLALVNPPREDNTDEFPIVYNETRNSPFLQDPQAHYASIVRFTCSTPLLPVLIPKMKPDGPLLDCTVYSVTMHHPGLNGGVPVRQYVNFTSVNPFLSRGQREYYYIYQPIQFINMVNQALAFCWEALGTAIPNNPPWIAWNHGTNVGTFFAPKDLCQTPYPDSQVGYPSTFSAIGGASSAAVSAVPVGPPAVGAPAQFANLQITLAAGEGARYLVGDYVNLSVQFGVNSKPAGFAPVRIISVFGDTIIVDQRGYAVGYQTAVLAAGANVLQNTPVNIYMNAALYTLFNSFAAENQATPTVPNPPAGSHWKLQFAPTNSGGELTTGSGSGQSSGGYETEYTLPQYGNFVAAPTASVVYLSQTQQYSSVPSWSPISCFVFTTSILPINPEAISIPSVLGNGRLVSGGNNSAYGTVLTDFEVPLDTGFENKPTITYVPSGEYRLVDMNGNAPIGSIEISLGWRDKEGVFQPLNIGPNGFAQLKILFRKKDFNGI